MSVDQLLDDVQDELGALWGSGLSLPGPDRPEALRALASRFDDLGLGWPSGELRALADRLGAEGAELECYAALQTLAAWVRTFRVGWSIQRARERLEAGPEGGSAVSRRAAGYSGVVSPVGLERAGNRLLVHALDASGRRVTLSDEVGELDERAPLHGAVTSKLFQDRVRYVDVLRHDLQLEDHPRSGKRGPAVFGPAFYTRPRLVARQGEVRRRLPGGRIAKGQLSRASLVVREGAEGWQLEHEGGDVTVTQSDALAFNLAKWAAGGAGPLSAVVLGRGDGAAVLECLDALGDRCFPAVDPGAIRWSGRQVREAAEGWSLGQAILGEGASEVLEEPWRSLLAWWADGPVSLEPARLAEPAAGHWIVWTHLVLGQPVPEAVSSRYTRTQLPEHPTPEEIAARGLCHGGAAGRALVEAYVSQLKRGVAQSGVIPEAWSLWAVADAAARLAGRDPREEPVAALGLPSGPLWLALVEALGPWLRGEDPDEDVAGALWLARVSGVSELLWVPGAG